MEAALILFVDNHCWNQDGGGVILLVLLNFQNLAINYNGTFFDSLVRLEGGRHEVMVFLIFLWPAPVSVDRRGESLNLKTLICRASLGFTVMFNINMKLLGELIFPYSVRYFRIPRSVSCPILPSDGNNIIPSTCKILEFR